MNVTGYEVGALLYCPANAHSGVPEALEGEKISQPFSLAFCLEDTVAEEGVAEAEAALYQTLRKISAARREREFYLPRIFIRVRSPRQMRELAERYGEFSQILRGFIRPKFFVDNCGPYIQAIQSISGEYQYMPILESPAMVDLPGRYSGLVQVRDALEAVSDQILNIRVGASDLSHVFGLRRHVGSTIYDLLPVARLLCDIVTTFAGQYVVSGPVWEYYGGPGWDTGLRRETEQDLLSGFTGKTVIHPNQIPVVNRCLQVSQSDYLDACRILNWEPDSPHLVSASTEATRMNEYNTHFRWAQRVSCLARIYGVRNGRRDL